MTFDDVMRELEAAGTEQNRKTYRRHGMPEPMFGVSFAKLGELRKRIRCDQALAERLWATDNSDARILATMVADPAQMDERALEAWLTGVRSHVHAGYLAELAERTPAALVLAERWLARPEALAARAGWSLLNLLALRQDATPDAYFQGWLPRIEREIHAAPNRVKEAMNTTLIAIGMRSDALADAAIASARRIGEVTVDHGDTSCKTPAAEPYIVKGRAHQAAKAAKAAAKPPKKARA